MDDRELLGKRIKEIRSERGLSQEALAERMEANWKYVSSIERGLENPTLDFLIKLSAALKVDLVDLFNFTWLRLSEREIKKQIKAAADGADVGTLREILAMMRARGV